jgi:hypothetical protein
MAKSTDKTANEVKDVAELSVVMEQTDVQPIQTPKISITLPIGSALLVRKDSATDYMIVEANILSREPYKTMLGSGAWEIADKKGALVQKNFSITVNAPKQLGCKTC